MSLPKLNHVVHTMVIPGTDIKFKYRPFTQGEYKMLLQSTEVGDETTFVEALKSIISACVYDIDITKIPLYQLDYVFLQIRGKSVGENLLATYKCNKTIIPKDVDGEGSEEEEICNTTFNVNIDLGAVSIRYPENFESKKVFKIENNIGIKLKSPSFVSLDDLKLNKGSELTDEYIFSCVECVFNGDEILLPEKDFMLEDFKEWVSGFSLTLLGEIGIFLKNQPSIFLNLDIKCPRCGAIENIKFKSLDDFFI